MDIADLKKKAERDDVVAQTVLGICYLEGIDVSINYDEAFRLLSLATEQGAPRAAWGLARMYAEGLGIPKNLREAVRLYELAARAGEFFAQIGLGRIYSSPKHGLKDSSAAMRWYSAAAAQKGHVADCDELREAQTYIRDFGRGA